MAYIFYCAVCRHSLRLGVPLGASSADIDADLIEWGWRLRADHEKRPEWVWVCAACDLWSRPHDGGPSRTATPLIRASAAPNAGLRETSAVG